MTCNPMRRLMTIIEAITDQNFTFIGTCVSSANAPYLEDMMDNAKKVSYREVYDAVGRDTLQDVFPQFYWGARPNRRRGDMALHQDPYVTFYKSTYRGVPCYFVCESGIEHIFVAPSYFSQEWHDTDQPVARRLAIGEDGSVAESLPGAVVYITISADVMKVVQSTRLNAAVAKTLLKMIDEFHPTVIDDDGDEQSVADYQAFVRSYL